MEERRLEETDEEALAAFRQGWCLGGEDFRRRLLEQMDGQLGEHHCGQLRSETQEVRAERIVAEELRRLGWQEADLTARRKGDPGKLALAARLRKETLLTIKAIAERVSLGTSKSANARLRKWMGGAGPPGAAQARLAP